VCYINLLLAMTTEYQLSLLSMALEPSICIALRALFPQNSCCVTLMESCSSYIEHRKIASLAMRDRGMTIAVFIVWACSMAAATAAL